MASYLGAIDQGTTSTRFIVFDRAGRIVASAERNISRFILKPGWVEHDAEEIWRRTQEVIAGALQQQALQPSDLAAIGITNQRETTVLWERKTGKPVVQRAGLAGHSRRRGGGGNKPGRRAGSFSRSHRVTAHDVLQRIEDPVAAGKRSRPAQASRGGRRAVRQYRYLPSVASDGRRGWWHPRHRRDQCQPHAVDESEDARLGCRHAFERSISRE